MSRYFLQLSYKGTRFHGWQVQKNAIGVQNVVNEALSTALGKGVVTTGSGRTDTGVHAREQFLHFDHDGEIQADRLIHQLNGLTPHDIYFKALYAVPLEASARFDATSRTYHYHIVTERDPFRQETAWFYPKPINIDALNALCGELMRYNDFQSFSKVKTEVKHFECKITEAHWQQDGTDVLFVIRADRFLRGMVRTVVGTLLQLSLQPDGKEALRRILTEKNRRFASHAAPPHGLFLERVEYPPGLLHRI